MILPMLRSLGRSIFTFFARPAPTSVALMAGPQPSLAANDDQSQMLRRAMQAATAAEGTREADAPEGVQIFEPISVYEADDSAAAQAAVFAPAKPMPAAAANDAVTHDAIDEPAFEGSVAPPIRLADWIEVEIDENAAAEADLPLEMLEAPVAEGSFEEVETPVLEAPAFETPVFDAPVEAVADDVELMPIETEPVVEEPAVELSSEDTVEVAAEAAPSEEPVAFEEAAVLAAAPDDVVEKKPRKKRAPAKRKTAAKPRKAKIVDDATAGPG
jgi:hypothetical protein